jgi:hypothetical protein
MLVIGGSLDYSCQRRQVSFTLPLRGRVGAQRRGGVICGAREQTFVFAVVTPTRSCAATSPLKGEVKVQITPNSRPTSSNTAIARRYRRQQVSFTLPLRGRVGAQRRGGVICGPRKRTFVFAVVTPTRSCAATSPLKGEVKVQITPNSCPTSSNTAIARRTSASLWDADIWVRMRAWSLGTTGKAKPTT